MSKAHLFDCLKLGDLRSVLRRLPSMRCMSSLQKQTTELSTYTTSNVEEEFLKPVIGLEIHAQLHCATKLFSGAPNCALSHFSSNCSTHDVQAQSTSSNGQWAPSNSCVSLFDMATPGTLPRLNRRSVEQCLRVAILLNCRVADWCRFDRKHYFYPDMPTGYQITQKDVPIAESGHMDFFVYPSLSSPFASLTPMAKSRKNKSNTSKLDELATYTRQCGIERLQLEMDSGKILKYDSSSSNGEVATEMELIDLNRAGIALVEIVTAPELRSAREAACFVEQLRELLFFNEICGGEMHKGHLRVDANISVSRGEKSGNRTEIKNINSFRFLQGAIEVEIRRQCALIRRGQEVVEETRNLDVETLETKSMREKGDRLDYRFTPEPNLPRLRIEPAWVENAKKSVTSCLPHIKYIQEYNFPPSFALQVVKDERLKHFIDKCLTLDLGGMEFEQFHAWIVEFKRICESEKTRNFPPDDNFLIRSFRDAIYLEFAGKLTRAICFDLLKESAAVSINQDSKGSLPTRLLKRIEEQNLWRINDPDLIRAQLETTIAERPDLMEKVLRLGSGAQAGNKHFNRLRNEVVFASAKRIDVRDAERILSEKLAERN